MEKGLFSVGKRDVLSMSKNAFASSHSCRANESISATAIPPAFSAFVYVQFGLIGMIFRKRDVD